MKKLFLTFSVFCWAALVCAKTAENEMYFRAMQDEMSRSLAQLHLQGEARPYYLAYYVEDTHRFTREAMLGALYPASSALHRLEAAVQVWVGSDRHNNTGFRYEGWALPGWMEAAKSYEGLRQALWFGSNKQYLQAVDTFKRKQAYQRKKNLADGLPAVVSAPVQSYIEPVQAWHEPDGAQAEAWVKKLSALGKELSFLETFSARLSARQTDTYWLNSRGGKLQVSYPAYTLWLEASFRQPDGYEEKESARLDLPDFSPAQWPRAEQKTREFLAGLQAKYNAVQGETYLGPVLFKPAAAAVFLNQVFLDELKNTVPFLADGEEEDLSASPWRKKVGMRVMSPGITVKDRPLQRTYEGIYLDNFYPVDGEGVPAQELTLVSGGRLKELPLARRPLKKGHQSNGHAFNFGREGLTTVFVEPEASLTDAQMEEKLLARCRELDLPYCYIKPENGVYERIYTQDGRKERVLGLSQVTFSARSLRDIVAAGGKAALVDRWIVTPSLLIDEIELAPQDRKPERKPFISKPE